MYKSYLNSREWKSKHPSFLRATGYRCQMFGVKVGRYKGKYYPYNIHHHTYERKGKEKWQRDVFVLSKRAHNLIHGWLALSLKPISVRQQNKNPINQYPNLLQQIAHAWCWLMGYILWILK